MYPDAETAVPADGKVRRCSRLFFLRKEKKFFPAASRCNPWRCVVTLKYYWLYRFMGSICFEAGMYRKKEKK